MSADMGKYSILYRPDLLQVFWAGMQAGDFITDAVIPLNTSRRTGRTVLAAAGGVRPRRGRNLKGRCLTFEQREEIAVLRAQGQSLRQIGEVIGRSASTVSRELRRNTKPGTAYRTTSAHVLAYERASRPKPAKLHTNLVLRAIVEEDLAKKYSPEQIAGRLRVQFPDEMEMWVSPETIYQSLYVQ
ncbi:helix-turn-helix domain-containing protein [Arthrobacter sp. lap29]|uniref:helix-turn-helix domain-containing protein n=1 Tax=Arthrobacter sp. lap29 TaxID=3056122 RepID=UPI0028F73BD4|nr:helix-turn-helix domain-containing protein [Arthrobacter sp. lap29]